MPSSLKEYGAGRVAFFKLKDKIADQLQAGRTKAAVYRDFKLELGISYPMFARYADRLLNGIPPSTKHPPRQAPPALQTESTNEGTEPDGQRERTKPGSENFHVKKTTEFKW